MFSALLRALLRCCRFVLRSPISQLIHRTRHIFQSTRFVLIYSFLHDQFIFVVEFTRHGGSTCAYPFIAGDPHSLFLTLPTGKLGSFSSRPLISSSRSLQYLAFSHSICFNFRPFRVRSNSSACPYNVILCHRPGSTLVHLLLFLQPTFFRFRIVDKHVAHFRHPTLHATEFYGFLAFVSASVHDIAGIFRVRLDRRGALVTLWANSNPSWRRRRSRSRKRRQRRRRRSRRRWRGPTHRLTNGVVCILSSVDSVRLLSENNVALHSQLFSSHEKCHRV